MDHSKATYGLCELNNTPTKLDNRPITKKGKKDTAYQVELLVMNNEGNSVVDKVSKGDTILATSNDMGIE